MTIKMQRGAAGQQYAIIVGLIAVIAILAIAQLGQGVNGLMRRTGNVLSQAANTSAGNSGTGNSAANDPDFAFVQLLMHMDGANNGNSFTDVKGHAITANGGAVTSTTQAKFGPTSLAVLNSNNNLSTTSCLTPGTGDYTVEMWILKTTLGGNDPLFDTRNSASNSTNGLLLATINSQLVVITNQTVAFQAGTLTTNTWYHVAVVRAAGNLTLYLNGVSLGTVAMANSLTDSSCLLARFVDSGTNPWYGYIDDVRITHKARYTSNFTPPTAAFPDQ